LATTPRQHPNPDLKRWGAVSELAHDFGNLLIDGAQTATGERCARDARAGRLRAPGPARRRGDGGQLHVTTAGRLWVDDVVTTAWQIVSGDQGDKRLAELQRQLGST